MTDYILMGLLLCFLAVVLLAGIKADTSESHFFDIANSKAMRGFWCLIVVLVHIPVVYQNRIQDMIGSFAYIGITFFFMTSGYGLTISSDKKSGSIDFFWRKRLPKLLIPGLIVNISFAIINYAAFSEKITLKKILNINDWVRWLLGCYLIFWLSHMLVKGRKWKVAASVTVITVSVLIYFLQKAGLITSVTWTTECYGFIWGIMLATNLSMFISFFKNGWLKKWVISFIISLLLGSAYLVFKPVFFLGDYVLKIVLGIAITMFILIANVRFSLGNRVNLFLGGISFEVYLVHKKIFHFISIVFPDLSSGPFIIISLFFAVLMAFFVHIIADFILKQLLKVRFFAIQK